MKSEKYHHRSDKGAQPIDLKTKRGFLLLLPWLDLKRCRRLCHLPYNHHQLFDNGTLSNLGAGNHIEKYQTNFLNCF